MPILRIFVDQDTHAILEREAKARDTGDTVETLAEAAIAEVALQVDRQRKNRR